MSTVADVVTLRRPSMVCVPHPQTGAKQPIFKLMDSRITLPKVPWMDGRLVNPLLATDTICYHEPKKVQETSDEGREVYLPYGSSLSKSLGGIDLMALIRAQRSGAFSFVHHDVVRGELYIAPLALILRDGEEAELRLDHARPRMYLPKPGWLVVPFFGAFPQPMNAPEVFLR